MLPRAPVYSIVNSIIDNTEARRVQISINGETNRVYRESINFIRFLEKMRSCRREKTFPSPGQLFWCSWLLQLIPAVPFTGSRRITEKCKGQVTGRIIRRTRKKEQLQLDLADCLIQNDTNTIEASHILVYLTDEAEYPVGADLSLSGTIYPIETPTNPGQFDSRLYYEGQGVDCTVYAEKGADFEGTFCTNSGRPNLS